MKVILPICLVLLYNNAFTTSQVLSRFLNHNPPPPNVTERKNSPTSSGVFIQKLDHFDSSNTQTWSQKFFVNSQFFTNDGNNVAFLKLGGEDVASVSWMSYGSWVTNAKQYGAILFQLEHRFYGSSQPFSDLATENLRYLSSQQALGDAAEFITTVNKQYSLGDNVKWIVFGGSYSGSLAAWLRLKYPDLVYAAVSSSGPLLAQVDYPGYFDVVVDDLKNVNEECAVNLKKAMATVDELLTNPNSSDETVTSIFNLCEPIEQYDIDHVNVRTFYLLIAYQFADAAQYNGLLGNTLDHVCNVLVDESRGSEIHRLADIFTGGSCTRYEYDNDVEYYRNIQIGGNRRQWLYQTCTEFGWYQTTNRQDKVFGRGAGVDYYTKTCSDVFGPDFDSTFVYSQINKTNADYLGTDINATRIVYIHGSVDPWHSAGLLKANNDDSPVIYIEGTSHCNDMYDKFEGDLPQLNEARDEVTRLIGVWLGYN